MMRLCGVREGCWKQRCPVEFFQFPSGGGASESYKVVLWPGFLAGDRLAESQ